MDHHNGEPGERPGQDEAFDAFGVRSGGPSGERGGGLVPYGAAGPGPYGGPDDPSAFDGMRPVEPGGQAPTRVRWSPARQGNR